MPGLGLFYNIMQTDLDTVKPMEAKSKMAHTRSGHRLCTSDKVRHMLKKFPSSEPRATSLAPIPVKPYGNIYSRCYSSNCTLNQHSTGTGSSYTVELLSGKSEEICGSENMQKQERDWVQDAIQVLQLVVSSTALLLYYVIYCWMQFVYNAMRIALFFHNADGPMKVTLGVVAVSSLVLGFNILMRLQKLYYSVLR